MPEANELPIDTDATATDIAEAVFGEGVEVVDATYTGASNASGIYSDGDNVAPGVTPADTGVILSTGNAGSITNSSGDANKVSSTSTNNKTSGDSDLNDIAGAKTYDAATLEASFIPEGETLTMQVTFSSEEYLEYVDSGFNDAVGIFVNGEPAELTVGDGDITINTINDESNENLYIDNPANAEEYNTEMDGLTVTLTLKAPVEPGEVNTIKISIADGGDAYYDSNLLIAGDSVQSVLVANEDTVKIHGTQEKDVDVLANDYSATGSTLTITEINGITVSAGDSVLLPSGETVTLNSDGTLCFTGDGDEDTNTFSYTVSDADGNSDVGYIELTTVPCFTAGTRIRTLAGPVAVEHLRPGDLVLTHSDGHQPVRWIGRSRFAATDRQAPICLEPGALGSHGRTELSPNHRIAVFGADAEICFGARGVLVRVGHLVNGTTIRSRADGTPVEYVHLLFDRHQIICGDGLWSESYQPGTETLNAFSAAARADLRARMPGLCPGHYPCALPSLRRYEARLLAGARMAAA